MTFFPYLELGWFNGWLLLVVYGLVFGIVMSLLPREVVRRLYDRSGWTRRQRILTLGGKLFASAFFVLLAFTPLRIGEVVFMIGGLLFVLGMAGVVAALLDYARTPLDKPVTRGLYRLSRNPQWVMLVVAFAGACIAVGSWTALLTLAVAVLFGHFRILAEERACLVQYGDSYREFVSRVPRYFLFC